MYVYRYVHNENSMSIVQIKYYQAWPIKIKAVKAYRDENEFVVFVAIILRKVMQSLNRYVLW